MNNKNRRLNRERRTLARLVSIYCDGHHGDRVCTPCVECRKLLDYAWRRLDKCPYGTKKPTCANCPVHCYKPAPRGLIRQVMRFAGPRMLLRHPVMAIAHVLDGRRIARHPREMSRAERLRNRHA